MFGNKSVITANTWGREVINHSSLSPFLDRKEKEVSYNESCPLSRKAAEQVSSLGRTRKRP